MGTNRFVGKGQDKKWWERNKARASKVQGGFLREVWKIVEFDLANFKHQDPSLVQALDDVNLFCQVHFARLLTRASRPQRAVHACSWCRHNLFCILSFSSGLFLLCNLLYAVHSISLTDLVVHPEGQQCEQRMRTLLQPSSTIHLLRVLNCTQSPPTFNCKHS